MAAAVVLPCERNVKSQKCIKIIALASVGALGNGLKRTVLILKHMLNLLGRCVYEYTVPGGTGRGRILPPATTLKHDSCAAPLSQVLDKRLPLIVAQTKAKRDLCAF